MVATKYACQSLLRNTGAGTTHTSCKDDVHVRTHSVPEMISGLRPLHHQTNIAKGLVCTYVALAVLVLLKFCSI